VPDSGILPIAPLQIAQVDTDKRYPGRGAIHFTMGGGR
jgi:hypothetical protein